VAEKAHRRRRCQLRQASTTQQKLNRWLRCEPTEQAAARLAPIARGMQRAATKHAASSDADELGAAFDAAVDLARSRALADGLLERFPTCMTGEPTREWSTRPEARIKVADCYRKVIDFDLIQPDDHYDAFEDNSSNASTSSTRPTDRWAKGDPKALTTSITYRDRQPPRRTASIWTSTSRRRGFNPSPRSVKIYRLPDDDNP
jgi:hypothetical protein